MNNIFPLIKRFKDVQNLDNTVILIDSCEIHGKVFRAGAIFSILGWKEINHVTYVAISKGSWEGLVNFAEFNNKLKKLDNE